MQIGFLKKFLKKDLKNLPKDSNFKDHLYALVLAGGGGTRIWPKSRNKTPKQFLPIFEGKTLTQITLKRLNKILSWERIFIVTVSEDYRKEILKEVPQMIKENILVEPARRETGPAHGLGALYISRIDPDAVILTEAADRLVKPVERYLEILLASAKVAYEKKVMVAVGIKPRYAHPGLGHIKKGENQGSVDGCVFYKIDKFVEKPPMEIAQKYTKSGDYYWNAGQFVWRADTILSSLEKNAPDIYLELKDIEKVIGTSSEESVLKKAYELMKPIAIDYAVAEKDKNFMVVNGDFDWSDIGDWKEVWENLPKDENNNVIIDGESPGGRVINIDTSDTLVHTDGRLIAIVDVDDVVIVDTEDILLVCKKSSTQSVKKIVENLKEKKEVRYL